LRTGQTRVETLTSVDEIGRQPIDSLGDDGFFTYEWLKTLEMVKPFEAFPNHFVIYEEGHLAAIALCFLEGTSQYATLEEYVPLARAARLVRSRLGLRACPPLVCYSPSSFHSRVLFGGGCDDRRETLRLLSRNMDAYCRRHGALLSAFPYVSERDALLMEELPRLGYLGSPLFDTFYLDIRWRTFEGYVSSLDSGMRRSVRREIRKCGQHGISIERIQDFAPISRELSALYSNLFTKYNKGKVCPLSSKFFNGLNTCARDKTNLFVARKDHDIVGFSLSLRQSDVLDVYVSGFDYGRQAKTDFTYFNLVYYAQIDLAIQEGIRRIHFRGASDEAKLRRGCKRERMYMFIKTQDWTLGPLIIQCLRLVNNMRLHGIDVASITGHRARHADRLE
jgi:predicted N-acyltransferase